MGVKWSELTRPIVCLAPMDGITNSAYRRVVRGFNSQAVLFSEFTSADGFLRSEKVRARLDFREEEHPFFVQLFGNNPQSFGEAARALEASGVAGIDINMGCPAKKIVSSQHGSGLMQDVNRACRIVESVAQATSLQVSVKTRLGWNDAEGLVDFVSQLVNAGASMITIHGRTYDQAFRGQADWGPIYDLKAQVAVPVLGNGDVADLPDGMARMGALDGFMIGRAAIGNPWVFQQNSNGEPPDITERVRVLRLHYEYMREDIPVRRALVEFRKHLAGYLKGIDHIKPLRAALMTAPDEGRFMHLLSQLENLKHREQQALPLSRAG